MESKEDINFKLEELFDIKIPWYRIAMPWLPIWRNNKHLRVFSFTYFSVITRVKPITKLHRFDLLFPLYKKWYHPPVGFQVWY